MRRGIGSFEHKITVDDITFITIALMLAGLVGCVLPVLPGPPLVWLGALYYAWRTEFAVVPIWLLALLLGIALVGGTADWWMGFLGAKKGGASPWGQVAATVGAILGLLVFSLPGMILGALAGLGAVEWFRQRDPQTRDWKKVARAGGGYVIGYLLSVVVEVFCALAIIALFGGKVWLAAR